MKQNDDKKETSLAIRKSAEVSKKYVFDPIVFLISLMRREREIIVVPVVLKTDMLDMIFCKMKL